MGNKRQTVVEHSETPDCHLNVLQVKRLTDDRWEHHEYHQGIMKRLSSLQASDSVLPLFIPNIYSVELKDKGVPDVYFRNNLELVYIYGKKTKQTVKCWRLNIEYFVIVLCSIILYLFWYKKVLYSSLCPMIWVWTKSLVELAPFCTLYDYGKQTKPIRWIKTTGRSSALPLSHFFTTLIIWPPTPKLFLSSCEDSSPLGGYWPECLCWPVPPQGVNVITHKW